MKLEIVGAIPTPATLRLREAEIVCPSTSSGQAILTKNKWWVYIIQCKDGSFYTGVTLNIKRRFQEHKEGRGGRYTLLHKPFKIIFSESFNTKQEALKREKQLKGWSRKKKENFIKFGKP